MQILILYSLISLFGIAQVLQGIKAITTRQFTHKRRTGVFPFQVEEIQRHGFAAKVVGLHQITSGFVLLLLVIATRFNIVNVDWLFLIAVGVVWSLSFSGHIVSSRVSE